MELYTVVLAAHIIVVLFAFTLAGAIQTSQWRVLRASTVQEMRILARPMAWGVGFAPVIALLLLLGGWMVQLSDDRDAKFSFSDGWVWTAAVVLVIAFVVGIGLEGPHSEKLIKALDAAPDGPATPELKALAGNRTFWIMSHVVPFAILGVVANMANKPGTAAAVIVILIGAVVGGIIGLMGSRQPAA
jgi:hypothetical protein